MIKLLLYPWLFVKYYVVLYVMFNKRAGVLYRDIKHEEIAECFRSHKARIASFLNGLKNKPLNTLIREESLKINVF